jgi:hypothetical protein
MIRLDPEESSTLTQIAQFSTNPSIDPGMLDDLLVDASPVTHEIASVLLGKVSQDQARPEVVETANYFRQWADSNVKYATSRIAAG